MTNKHDDASAELLIQEVDEELRHEQLHTLWKKYGNLAIAGVLAIVLAVAGVQAWTAWRGKLRAEASAQFSAAAKLAEGGKKAEAAAAYDALAAKGTDGYKLLARLQEADLALRAGDVKGAVAFYDAVAADRGVDDAYRNLARIKSAYLRLDGADPSAVEKEVEPLAAEASPWRHSAREIMGLSALKKGERDKAADIFRKLADDPAAPQALRGRAAELLAAAGGKTKG